MSVGMFCFTRAVAIFPASFLTFFEFDYCPVLDFVLGFASTLAPRSILIFKNAILNTPVIIFCNFLIFVYVQIIFPLHF